MIKRFFLLSITTSFIFSCGINKNNVSKSEKTESSQVVESSVDKQEIVLQKRYNPSATILTDLIHTKLEIEPIWERQELEGIATITASPYFYETDSLILDAKAMDIHKVTLNDFELGFKYNDKQFLRIGLDKTYNRNEEYTIKVFYTAKPEEKELGGSSAISSDKGLYFINPTGETPNKMPQIWTQGETEASSVWFPTIDRPNQKMSQEVFVTVDQKYVTLSNGKFMGSVEHENGKRTDHWKQELPHVPYLAALVVGEFKVIEDVYVDKEGREISVNYYVEPEWEEHAKAIFGETPEMIAYFSDLLGVPFPWDKYHQVVVREYVSGAMENTGAVVFGDFVYKTKRELIDENNHAIIAHELFHHWFGDLVTCESWANLPLNESFANYSQYLWDEYYYGVDHAELLAEKEAQGYFQQSQQAGYHDMIWFDYEEKEEMFDAHSYNKGGRILHMLRNYLGDDAFFASLNKYLTDNAYKPAEMHHLRLAFEEVTGEDLNWFFNQWFFASRHPVIKVDMEIDTLNSVTLTLTQKQNLDKAPLYKIPTKIAVYDDKGLTIHEIVIDKSMESFTFPVQGDLKNVIVDADRVLLGAINFKKPNEFYYHQFYNAPKYKDREEGVLFGSRVGDGKGDKLLFDALNDDFWHIRQLAVSKMGKLKSKKENEVYNALKSLVKNDENSKVRAAAVSLLSKEFFQGNYQNETSELLKNTIKNDASYLVIGRALNGLTNGSQKDIDSAMGFADDLKSEQSSALKGQIANVYGQYGNKSHLDYFANSILNGEATGYDIIGVLGNYTKLLQRLDLETQRKELPKFIEFSKVGGAYANAIIPINLTTLRNANLNKISVLEKDLEAIKNKGDQQAIDLKMHEIENISNFIDEIQLVLSKIVG